MGNNLHPIHGSTDSGPTPRYDFSSNANALGPNPIILSALQSVDPTHYPDYTYHALHQALANHHQVQPEQVAIGAGASELILRLAYFHRDQHRPVLTFSPTFSEYSRAAQIAGLPVLVAKNEAEFCDHLSAAGLAFLCIPNNPTGTMYSEQFLQTVAARSANTTVIVDLAYRDLSQQTVPIPPTFWQLHAPNKAHGMTGIRAGYLIAPTSLQHFRNFAPAWVLSAHGEAFLLATLRPEAQDWVKETRQILWQWRDRLQAKLQNLGYEQSWSQANFGLINVSDATAITQALRNRGIRVRDCTSFGLPQWIRISAQDAIAQDELIRALLKTKHVLIQ
jgi:histidinol-phosphate aminotransferase